MQRLAGPVDNEYAYCQHPIPKKPKTTSKRVFLASAIVVVVVLLSVLVTLGYTLFKTSSSRSSTCDLYWTHFPESNSCYRAYNTRQTLEDGIETCRLENGHLASIHSAEENEFVVQLVLKDLPGHSMPSHRIGGRVRNDGTYRWLDGSAWSYSNWNTEDRQAIPKGDCVDIMNFYDQTLWNTSPCEWWRPTICKKSAH